MLMTIYSLVVGYKCLPNKASATFRVKTIIYSLGMSIRQIGINIHLLQTRDAM